MIKESSKLSKNATPDSLEDLTLNQTEAETIKGGPQSSTIVKNGCGTLTLTGAGPII